MSDSKISFMIGCGWFAAGINAFFSLWFALQQPGGQGLSYRIGAVFLLLAVGIFLRIDWCALIALVLFLGFRFFLFETVILSQQRAGNGSVILSFWISAIMFAQLYVLSLVGTLLWNARHPEVRFSMVALWRRIRGEVSPEPYRRNP